MKTNGYRVFDQKGQDSAGIWESEDTSEWAIWAIDGAWALGEETAHDVSNLSHTLSLQLHSTLNTNGLIPARGILKRTLGTMTSRMNATATLTLATSNGEILTLGDSEALLSNGTRIINPDFDNVEKSLMESVQESINQGTPPTEAYDQLRPHLLARRETRNQANGSGWVIGDKNKHLLHEKAYTETFDPALSICVMTDGMSRVLEWGLSYDLIQECLKNNLDHIVQQLRAQEERDPHRTNHLRFSQHDDASIAWSLQ